MVILSGGWTLIMLVNMYDNSMINYLNQYSFLKYVSSFFPSLLLSLINNIVPLTIKQITYYEAWDFQDQLIKQQVWRMYLAKIMNLAIFVFINILLLFSDNFFSITLSSFNENGQNFDCKEDQVAINLFKQVSLIISISLCLIHIWLRL